MTQRVHFIQIALMFVGIWAMLGCSSQATNNSQGNTIKITGEFSNPQKGIVALREAFPVGQSIVDTSVQVSGKTFSFEVVLEETDFLVLTILNKRQVLVVTDNDEIHFDIDTQSGTVQFKVNGSPGTEANLQLEAIVAEYKSGVESLKKKDVDPEDTTDMRQQMEAEYTQLQQASVEKVKGFIEEVMPSVVAIRAAQILDPNQEIHYMQKLVTRFQKELPDSKFTTRFAQQVEGLAEQIEGSKRLMLGKPAPEIALENPAGEIVKLSSLQGKLVLIDFWASWCRPCRAENPRVLQVYNRYKDKGFEIYGVSIDQDKEAWLQAIEDDGIAWLHVSDLKFWQSPVVKDYQIGAIPATYLIDEEGKIVAKNLRGRRLEEKVSELLN